MPHQPTAMAPRDGAASRPRDAKSAPGLTCPGDRALRDRLRAMAADLVASWKSQGLPPGVRSAANLRRQAEVLVERIGGDPGIVGWTMVTIVSEYWRERLAAGPAGRRLLLLPDCPLAVHRGATPTGMPLTCGPGCAIGTVWSAAHESGWTVTPTAEALGGIGALLTGQYDGILGVARLSHLEKAFGMLPAFSLPIAAVPFDADGAAEAARGKPADGCAGAVAAGALDVEWILGLLGVAGGAAAPMGDYLPVLREAAGLFSPEGLRGLERSLGWDACGDGGVTLHPAAPSASAPGDVAVGPLDATAVLSTDFLCRGGKFLRPFITLAAFDAVAADRRDRALPVPVVDRTVVHAAAVAIEMFHKASLIHDDIEDDDAMRYGRPTMHAERGVPVAINTGDYMLGLGYRIVAGLPGMAAEVHRDLLGLLADAHVRLARGQGGELWWRSAADKRLQPAEALELYALKTSPAFEAALAMGVRLAGSEPRAAGDLHRYALHVGTGFQVLNDLKDWKGDVENARVAAGDLLGGRPTVLWALAVERLGVSAVAHLFERAREGTAEERTRALLEARTAFTAAGVFTRAVAMVQAERSAALAAAAGCALPRLREVLDFLLDLAVPDQAVTA